MLMSQGSFLDATEQQRYGPCMSGFHLTTLIYVHRVDKSKMSLRSKQ